MQTEKPKYSKTEKLTLHRQNLEEADLAIIKFKKKYKHYRTIILKMIISN